jgi:putative MATE family efflux protein
MGWRGIAIGTVSGFVIGAGSVLVLLLRGRAGLRLRLHWLRPRANLIRRLLRIGVPGGADMLSVIACQLWFLSVINRLGDLATAAHGVAIAIESFAFLPGVAFQMSATTLCGQYLGARDYHRATRSVLMALLVGGGFMCFAAAIFFTQADHLAYVLLRRDQAEVARQVEPLLRIIAVGVPPLALAMILSGALRGAGDTRWPLAISLVGLLGVRLPMAYWLCFPSVEVPVVGWVISGWDLGIIGAWYAMVTDLMLRASLVLARFLHGGWKRIEV